MNEPTALHGDLQQRVMQVLWRRGDATVEEVRTDLPDAYRGAYTTVQTVLNRLVDRGLLARERRGKSFVYRPVISEGEFVSGAIRRALDSASDEAREAALVELLGGLDQSSLSVLRRRAKAIERRRRSP
jgi:predicted transcriptional regulator